MDMSRLHLVLATPCFGGMVTQRYMQSAMALMQVGTACGFAVNIELLGHDSLITRSRNALVAKFLDTETASHLLFVDADIGFSTAQVARMLRFDQDIVAGMYPLKLQDWNAQALQRLRDGETPGSACLRYVGTPCSGAARIQQDGFVSGEFAGTGCMLIKRQALLRMIAAYPQTRYTAAHTSANPSASPHQYALFDGFIEPETGHYLSEDYGFCHRWRAIGGQLWLDTQSSLVHVGAMEFTGDPATRFAEAGARHPQAA